MVFFYFKVAILTNILSLKKDIIFQMHAFRVRFDKERIVLLLQNLQWTSFEEKLKIGFKLSTFGEHLSRSKQITIIFTVTAIHFLLRLLFRFLLVFRFVKHSNDAVVVGTNCKVVRRNALFVPYFVVCSITVKKKSKIFGWRDSQWGSFTYTLLH